MYGLLCSTRVLAVAFGILGGHGCSQPSVPAISSSSAPMQAPAAHAAASSATLLPMVRPARGAGLVVGIRVPFDWD